MARIFRHPLVEDYFHELDCNSELPSVAAKAGQLYESGQVILLRNANIDCDRQFLSKLNLTDKEVFKKLKSISLCDSYSKNPKTFKDTINRCFDNDEGKFKYFTQQVAAVNAQVADLIHILFPTYSIIRPSITWRMTETINENLHVDVYNDDLPDHHIRVFVNLDVVPRIWHTSHTLETLLEHHLDLLDEQAVHHASAGRICHALNFAIFKGFEEAGREGSPKHIVFFEPGEVWAVDSRKVSHQIFYGRKALSTEYSVRADSMLDPSQHYFAIVERYRSSWLALQNRKVVS